MPVLPIPMIIALVLLVLLVHRLLTRETHVTLLALIGVCAVQSTMSALVQYYGISALHPLRPLVATFIPPIAWLAFSHASGDGRRQLFVIVHVLGPFLALLFLMFQTQLLDALIAIQFAVYGMAMLLRLARGEDSLPHSLLESGTLPLLTWRIVAVSLIVSAAADVVIGYYLTIGQTGVLLWMPSILSSLTLLGLGAVSLSHAIESRRDEDAEPPGVSLEEAERDQAIIAKLENYVDSDRPYLDADLTLARLSRKLLVPAKQLSVAINRTKGENVSRYINRHRIEHACQMIASGKSVTEAMLSSGFNTKSNFNREFLRVKGSSPSKWVEVKS